MSNVWSIENTNGFDLEWWQGLVGHYRCVQSCSVQSMRLMSSAVRLAKETHALRSVHENCISE